MSKWALRETRDVPGAIACAVPRVNNNAGSSGDATMKSRSVFPRLLAD
jgi:hypothetical protein